MTSGTKLETSEQIDVTFSVPMEPKAKARAVPVKAGRYVRMVKDRGTRQWEATLAQIAALHLPEKVIENNVRVDVLAVLTRPAYMRKKNRKGEYKFGTGLLMCGKRPDIDNLRKSVMDALKPFWVDDCLVVDGRTVKCYAELDGRARVVVRIRSTEVSLDDGFLSELEVSGGPRDGSQEEAQDGQRDD